MPTKASDYFTIIVTVSRFMLSGGAHSLLLPVCVILIYPFSFFSFISVSKNSLPLCWCTLWFAPEIDWVLETPTHVHTTRRILAWWHFYNFQLSVRSKVDTQIWQLKNQHRIVIKNPRTGKQITSLNELSSTQANCHPSYRCPPYTHTHTHTHRVWKSVHEAPVECNSIPGNRSLCPMRHSVSKSNDSVANRQISKAPDESSETHKNRLNSNTERRLSFISVPLSFAVGRKNQILKLMIIWLAGWHLIKRQVRRKYGASERIFRAFQGFYNSFHLKCKNNASK